METCENLGVGFFVRALAMGSEEISLYESCIPNVYSQYFFRDYGGLQTQPVMMDR